MESEGANGSCFCQRARRAVDPSYSLAGALQLELATRRRRVAPYLPSPLTAPPPGRVARDGSTWSFPERELRRRLSVATRLDLAGPQEDAFPRVFNIPLAFRFEVWPYTNERALRSELWL